MIILVTGQTGWKSDGFVFLGDNKFTEIEAGDVVRYGNGSAKGIESDDYQHPDGFVIDGFAGWTIGKLCDFLSPYYVGQTKFIAVWRKHEPVNTKPKEYIPSEWAKPLPLP